MTNGFGSHVASANNRVTSNISPIADDAGHRAPSYIQYEARTAESPARERFAYSPVRQASYTSTVQPQQQQPREIRSRVEAVAPRTTPSSSGVNAGWETVEY